MCILCAIQKWSRRVATMLPWLVIPLIGLWALSQLLPPAFRFEITSPRLACVFVLVVTLLWYEILMPQLSAWRVRRNARMRERKRFEAIELQKLRKTATRRCRNCLTPYRDQNPGGGKFMCSYCGHISKRPVLDLPLPPGMNNLSSGIVKDLVGKSGKAWSENSWTCNGQDYMENGNWTGGSIPGKSVYWRNGEGMVFGLDEGCVTEKSYSRVVISACKLLRSFLSSFRWLSSKIFRVGSLQDGVSVDGENGGSLAGTGENGTNCQESRSEKARRKAEEKRQARLEKEQLEEEERKQREEVARLVEERRKIRDECEKDRARISSSIKERQKKEVEKKRQERKKNKDKGSCKSNSDIEEMEKKVKENDRKRDSEKGDNDMRESQKSGVDSGRGYSTELGYGSRGGTASYTRANTGTRYLDRVKGTLLSSSKAFSRGNLFGRSASNPTAAVKDNRFVNSSDHSHAQAHRKDASHSGHVTGRLTINGYDKLTNRPVSSEPQSTAAPKKSWGKLFSRSSTTIPPSSSNVISRPQTKDPSDGQRSLPGQSLPTQSFDNPLDFGLPSPFTLSSFPNGSISTSTGFHSSAEYMLPLSGGSPQNLLLDEPELFEDPCYIPDPASLLGPVSESLDNFQLDLGTGFGNGFEKPFNVSAPCELLRPSPIESPLSRLKVNDDTQKSRNTHCSLIDDPASNNDNGSWQMWNSSPLVQNGLVGGSLNWLLKEPTQSTMEENVYHSSYQPMASLFTSNDTIISGNNSPVKAVSRNSLSGGSVTSPFHSAVDCDPWPEKTFFPLLSDSENHPILNLQEEGNQNHESPKKSARSSSFDQSPVNSWSKNQWSAYKSGEGLSSSGTTVVKPLVGGLYSTRDAQSLWSV